MPTNSPSATATPLPTSTPEPPDPLNWEAAVDLRTEAGYTAKVEISAYGRAPRMEDDPDLPPGEGSLVGPEAKIRMDLTNTTRGKNQTINDLQVSLFFIVPTKEDCTKFQPPVGSGLTSNIERADGALLCFSSREEVHGYGLGVGETRRVEFDMRSGIGGSTTNDEGGVWALYARDYPYVYVLWSTDDSFLDNYTSGTMVTVTDWEGRTLSQRILADSAGLS